MSEYSDDAQARYCTSSVSVQYVHIEILKCEKRGAIRGWNWKMSDSNSDNKTFFFYRFRIEWRRDSESGMANTIARRVKREWDKLVCTLRGDRYSSGAFPIVLQCFCLFSSLSLPLARYTPITIAHHPIVFVFALTVQNDWIEIKRRHDWNCELFDNLTMIVTVSHLGCRKAERTSVFCQNNW